MCQQEKQLEVEKTPFEKSKMYVFSKRKWEEWQKIELYMIRIFSD